MTRLEALWVPSVPGFSEALSSGGSLTHLVKTKTSRREAAVVRRYQVVPTHQYRSPKSRPRRGTIRPKCHLALATCGLWFHSTTPPGVLCNPPPPAPTDLPGHLCPGLQLLIPLIPPAHPTIALCSALYLLLPFQARVLFPWLLAPRDYSRTSFPC